MFVRLVLCLTMIAGMAGCSTWRVPRTKRLANRDRIPAFKPLVANPRAAAAMNTAKNPPAHK